MSQHPFNPCSGPQHLDKCDDAVGCTLARFCRRACTTGVPTHRPYTANFAVAAAVPVSDPAEVDDLRRSVRHVHDWIHSGDRATDPEVQAGQWGVNVCEWLTRYCTRLRAENARLTAVCASRPPTCTACGRAYAFRVSRDGQAEVYACETPDCADRGAEFEMAEYHGKAVR